MATTRSRVPLGFRPEWTAWVVIMAVVLVILAAVVLYVL